MKAATVAERLAEVRGRIADAGGSPDDVTIVAVTKGFGADAVDAAIAGGVRDVGENYAQELEDKARSTTVAGARWHFLGRVQRNKVGRLVPFVHLWQGVDRVAAGEAIARNSGAGPARVLVQVNVSGQPNRNGCDFDEAPGVVGALTDLGLDVRGLMGIGPAGPPELARPGFRRLAELADRLGLQERSMGMTRDLEVAVQEGATMIRVGQALFGARTVQRDLRR